LALLVNRINKWAFIHIPKTGGTSVSSILESVNGTETITGHDSIRLLTDLELSFIFCFVRNPFTRVQSAYQHSLRKKKHNFSFGDFLKNTNPNDLWLLPQTFYINSGKTEKNKISFIGKYENFENDLNFILKEINLNNIKIPHLNRNPIYDKHPNLNQQQYYKHLYEEEWMKDWVRERYKDDFKQFDYELEI